MARIVQSQEIKKSLNPTTQKFGVIEDSKFIQQIEYNEDSFQLTVTMKNGAQYLYQTIYKPTFDDFMQSNDKDSFYNQQIKGNPSSKIINKNVGKRSKKL